MRELRDYQLAAVRAVSNTWATEDRGLLVMATGTGKTVTFTDIVRRRKAAGRGRALILAHRIELLFQAKAACEAVGLTAEIESGDSLAGVFSGMFGISDVVIATVQTMRGRRLERWPKFAFSTIIVDEAHHSVSLSYRKIFDHFVGAKILGVTATPDRGDNIALGHVFPHVSYEYSLRRAISEGNLCPIRVVQVDAPYLDLSSMRVTKQEHGRDYRPEDLAAQMKDEKHLHLMASPIVRESGERQTIVFTPTVETAHELARVMSAYTSAGVASLDGKSADVDRKRVLKAYNDGRIRYLVNCALFTEGFDAPSTACVVVARNTQSRALYAQMIGRGTRLAEGKTDLLVLDIANVSDRHSLVKPIDLFDGKPLPDDVKELVQAAIADGESVTEAIEKGERIAEEREQARERERKQAKIAAEVRHARREFDPMLSEAARDLGVDDDMTKKTKGVRATAGQIEALKRLGIELGREDKPSRAQAVALLNAAKERSKAGLCTLKQSRLLRRHGLRSDLPAVEASAAIATLATNGYKLTPEVAARWG